MISFQYDMFDISYIMRHCLPGVKYFRLEAQEVTDFVFSDKIKETLVSLSSCFNLLTNSSSNDLRFRLFRPVFSMVKQSG